MPRWSRALGVVAVLIALATPAAALADGDPASDYLYTGSLFLPLDGSIPAGSAGQLRALLADSKKKGYEVRVAVIGSKTDLGAVPSLFERPQYYAPFLGQELRYLYKGPVLVVMPNGYGFYKHGEPVAKEKALLAKLPLPSTAPDLAQAAVPAVQGLAALSGVALPTPPLVSGASPWRDRLLIVGGALVVIAAASAVIAYRRGR